MNSAAAGGCRPPFTASQWQELEHQALIFKYFMAGVPMPPDLLIPIRRSFEAAPARFYHHPAHPSQKAPGVKFPVGTRSAFPWHLDISSGQGAAEDPVSPHRIHGEYREGGGEEKVAREAVAPRDVARPGSRVLLCSLDSLGSSSLIELQERNQEFIG